MKLHWVLICAGLCIAGSAHDSVKQDDTEEVQYIPAIYEEDLEQYVCEASTHLRTHVDWNDTEIFVMDDGLALDGSAPRNSTRELVGSIARKCDCFSPLTDF